MKEGHGGYAGPSLRELCMRKLDEVVARIKTGSPLEGDKFLALGIAECVAIFTSPYSPNVDAVREEAAERWNARKTSENQ